jgi:Na+/H+ antiporter NhaD/arsenite permease-like protein
MNPQLVLSGILVLTLVLQALLPKMRLLLVLAGAGLTCLASSLLQVGTTPQLLREVPWDVLVILVGLGLLSELFVGSRLFDVLAVAAGRWSRADPRKLIVLFALGMYAVSGLVNNLTALLLVLPVLLSLFKLLGVRQRYVSWTLGLLLVACNLGGAATPIGDFPAILLLGRGSMGFGPYLVRALPATFVALLVLITLVVTFVRPSRGLDRSPLASRLTLATLGALYRKVEVDGRRLAPPALALGAMLVGWLTIPSSTGVTPELICWIGAGAALLAAGVWGERIARTRVDAEAALFLLALFVMVAAVKRSGMFTLAAHALVSLPVAPKMQLAVFLVGAALLTGVFSAGPSMAALLEVAAALAEHFPGPAVYVGLALAVCAGSSLFLTAATSGPLSQALTERADLRDPEGVPLRFGFFDFLPAGLLGFSVILAVALGWTLIVAS